MKLSHRLAHGDRGLAVIASRHECRARTVGAVATRRARRRDRLARRVSRHRRGHQQRRQDRSARGRDRREGRSGLVRESVLDAPRDGVGLPGDDQRRRVRHRQGRLSRSGAAERLQHDARQGRRRDDAADQGRGRERAVDGKEFDRMPSVHRVRWIDAEGNGRKMVVNAPLGGVARRAARLQGQGHRSTPTTLPI